MRQLLQFVVRKLIQLTDLNLPQNLDEVLTHMDRFGSEDQGIVSRAINLAFLTSLGGEKQPGYEAANALLDRAANQPGWAEVGSFYFELKQRVLEEIEREGSQNSEIAGRLRSLSSWLDRDLSRFDQNQIVERFWSTFHPEAAGIWSHESRRNTELRQKRKITLTHLNPEPIDDPARQILFTANALLTIPPRSRSLAELSLSPDFVQQLESIAQEDQIYWYDHPIQIGTAPENNEVLYGLQGLQRALEFEYSHGTSPPGAQLTCLLSVSVTHAGLHQVARRYLEDELQKGAPLPGLKIYIFTEDDTNQLITEVLAPAAEHYLGEAKAADLLWVFGVDGEYGRHYTFLKAIAALWRTLIDPQIKGTFKIDLDQVFPQAELVNQTGSSAFEHLQSPLWGASGWDAKGESVELGMIAGALVKSWA
jgi:hypothetical protein